ncbi:hypothetical protein AAIR98_000688 [Elusimicrobium simillimum]|uniref:hypothetical protein n=1 Tax=Elusimicrobium simillimum TaxID=3143438 RepID=UPI003C6EE0B9
MRKLLTLSKKFMRSNNKVALTLFLLFFISLLSILQDAAMLFVKTSSMKVLEGVIYYIPDTRKHLFWYIISVPFIFAYALSGLAYRTVLWGKVEAFFRRLRRTHFMSLFIIAMFIINIFILRFNIATEIGWGFIVLIWLFAYLTPVIFGTHLDLEFDFLKSKFAKKTLYVIVLVCSILYLGWMLKPFIYNKLVLMNEYWDIPTTPKNSSLNSNDIVNKYKLLTFHKKYDILNPIDNYKGHCLDVPKTPEVEKYIEFLAERDKMFTTFAYEDGKGLCFAFPPAQYDRDMLVSLFYPATHLEKHFLRLDIANASVALERKEIFRKTPQFKFIRNNGLQFQQQILNRWYIHHHNHLLGAVNELHLGRPIKDIFMQYGLLNAVLFEKVMSAANSLNYGTYHRILYSFYIVYFAMFLALIWYITRKIQYPAIAMMVSLTGFNMLTYQYFYLGPGLNPVRRLFDLPLFFTWYKYIQTGKKSFFITSLLLCVVAVLNNTEFGLMLTIALMGSVFANNVKNFRTKIFNFETTCALATFILIAALVVVLQYGSVKITMGFLSGLLAFPIPAPVIIASIITIFAAYFIFMFIKKQDKALAHLFLLVLLYTQGLLIFWFRSYAPYHAMPFIMIYMILFVIAVKAFFDKYPRHETKALFAVTVLTIITFVSSIYDYTKTMRAFNRVIKNNVTYEWTLPGTNFISTMNPAYFEDSAKLIQKYTPNEKGIYIVSKYDNFIPLISGRYSALPVIDLQWYLITPQDMKDVEDAINKANPKYVFADKDFAFRRFEYDAVHAESPFGAFNEESMWRVQRLNQMKKLFKKVTACYTPVESSTLLTVYEKKDSCVN